MKKLYRFCLILVLTLSLNNLTHSFERLVFSGIKGAVNSDISMRVLKEAYAKLGIDIEMRELPGERALRTSNSGEVDGEVFRIANVQKKYKNLIPVPTSINILQGIVFVKDKKFKVDGWTSLKPYKIGTQIGIKFVERGTKGMRRTMVQTNEQLFKMLSANRIDIAVVAHTNGLKTLKKTGIKGVKALKPAVQTYPLYHYLHKKNAQLIPKLDLVLKKMQQQGRIDEIRELVINELKE